MADKIIFISVIISLIAVGISLIRFIKGKSVLSRVVAFDVASIIIISIIGVLAHLLGRYVYIDVAIVYSLLSFLGVLVVARYFEKGL